MNNESTSSQETNFMSHNHLKWIYDRLIHVHGENPNFDYMIKFKSEIEKVAACRQSIAELINVLESLKNERSIDDTATHRRYLIIKSAIDRAKALIK